MLKLCSFTLLIGILFISTSCKEKSKNLEIKTPTIEFKKEGALSIYKSKTDSVISSLDIEIAQTDYETQTGLMYRDSMAKNNGMLFIFKDEQPRSFYMKNTKIPLDIIYINSDKKIVSIQKNAKPMDESSLPSEKPAKYVLEVNAGFSNEWRLKSGDSISYNKL